MSNQLSFEECAKTVALRLELYGEADARQAATGFRINLAHDAQKLMRRALEIRRLRDAAPALLDAAYEALNQINIAERFVLSAPRPEGYAHPADCLKSGSEIIRAAIAKATGEG